MKRSQYVAIIAALVASIAAGCGTTPVNNQPPPPAGITVAVAPSSATVQVGGVQQFTATVTPSGTNQAVTWSISGTGCAGASCGTIDATGRYTAPATTPNPPTVAVTARLVADPNRAATAMVSIISVPSSSLSLNPTAVAFGNQTVNTTSAPRTVTLTNTGSAAEPVSARMNGINFGDFAQTNNCPPVIAAGASCIFSITFKPSATGGRIGYLVIDGNSDEEGIVDLSGTGVAGTTGLPGTFTAVSDMSTPRSGHTATLLPNGKVLIAGGARDLSAELYDPSTGTFTPTGNMAAARTMHTATLLANGKVLVAGGLDSLDRSQPLASAELYDPSTGMFTPTGSMTTAQGWRPATLLGDGKVFIANDSNAELYDPATGTFALTGAYADPTPVLWLTATSLLDGRVLLTGCAAQSCAGAAELFDPLTGTFSVTGPRHAGRVEVVNTATLLTNGTVLVVESTLDPWPEDVVEVYDPATGTFTVIANTGAPAHEFSAAVRLSDGTVLIAGGDLPGGNGHSATELYLPATRTFALAGNMTTARYFHTATLLSDGTVLIAGGYSTWPSPTSSAEIHTPARSGPSPAGQAISLVVKRQIRCCESHSRRRKFHRRRETTTWSPARRGFCDSQAGAILIGLRHSSPVEYYVRMPSSARVTQLLLDWNQGNAEALNALMTVVYEELRRLARGYLRRERVGHTLTSGALVHEAYLRLVDQRRVRWQNRSHFFGISAQLMRRILVDHARKRRAAKRGANKEKLTLHSSLAGAKQQEMDLIALDDALNRLAELDAQQSKIVELRFFGGLSIEDTSEVLGISPATVKRDWAMAKAWLYKEMNR